MIYTDTLTQYDERPSALMNNRYRVQKKRDQQYFVHRPNWQIQMHLFDFWQGTSRKKFQATHITTVRLTLSMLLLYHAKLLCLVTS